MSLVHVLEVVTVVAVGYALYKHITVVQFKADIAAEIAKLRTSSVVKVAIADYEKVVTAIRSKL